MSLQYVTNSDIRNKVQLICKIFDNIIVIAIQSKGDDNMSDLTRFHWEFFKNYKVPVANFAFSSAGKTILPGSYGPRCYGNSFIDENGSAWGSEDCKLFGNSFMSGDAYISDKTTIKNSKLSGFVNISASHIYNSKLESKSKDSMMILRESIVSNSKLSGRINTIQSKIFWSDVSSGLNNDLVSIQNTTVKECTIKEFVVLKNSFISSVSLGNRTEITFSTFKSFPDESDDFYIMPTFFISESKISFSNFVGGADIGNCKIRYAYGKGSRLMFLKSKISGQPTAIIRFFDGVSLSNSEFFSFDSGYSVGISKKTMPIGSISFVNAKINSPNDFFIYELFNGLRVLYRRSLDLSFMNADDKEHSPDEIHELMLKHYEPTIKKICDFRRYKSNSGSPCLWLKWFVFSDIKDIDNVVFKNVDTIEKSLQRRFSARATTDLISILRFNMAEAAEKIYNVESKGSFYRPWKGGKSSKKAIMSILSNSLNIKGKNVDMSKRIILTNETIGFLSRSTHLDKETVKEMLLENGVDFVIIR